MWTCACTQFIRESHVLFVLVQLARESAHAHNYIVYKSESTPRPLRARFYAYYFLMVHLHYSSKIKSHKEVTEQFFLLLLFCLMMEGSGFVQIMTDPGGPQTYDPTDQDPNLQDWCGVKLPSPPLISTAGSIVRRRHPYLFSSSVI